MHPHKALVANHSKEHPAAAPKAYPMEPSGPQASLIPTRLHHQANLKQHKGLSQFNPTPQLDLDRKTSHKGRFLAPDRPDHIPLGKKRITK